MPRHTNALAHETSPYLLQHAHNPVDWLPWGQEALSTAADTDKLMLISIGYAACHWCHVMERESFEDEQVANIMNTHFVCVKVDREERPDVDEVYMTACQLSGGGACGWPLNAIALPDGRPIWAGTYFPKQRWMDLLGMFVELKQTEYEKLLNYARQIEEELQVDQQLLALAVPIDFEHTFATHAAQSILALVDQKNGGFGAAPKFPLPVGLSFLLDEFVFSGESQLWSAVEQGLTAMLRGGIFDQLGGGWSRYAVDAAWHAPHFEKMLYDNSQLISLYSRAFRQNLLPEFKVAIEKSLGFIERELTNPNGGFYSSLDADSEGVEGKFYVWTFDELQAILSAEELRVMQKVYGITQQGNWEHDFNILHRQASDEQLALELSLTTAELKRVLAKAEAKLFQVRTGRIGPSLDDKILVSWNALMLSGYVDAYLALGDDAYLATAQQSAHYLEQTFMQADGRLLRTSAKGRTHVNAFLDDYANLTQAYLDLFQADFDEHWLSTAQRLADYALEYFAHPSSSLLYYTSYEDTGLVARRIEKSDNVLPASNSVFAGALHTLGTILGDEAYLTRAKAMLGAVIPEISTSKQALYWSRWLSLYAKLSRPSFEVAIVGPEALQKRRELGKVLTPQATFIGSTKESKLELLAGKEAVGETLIYVCSNRTCKQPTQKASEAIALLSHAEQADIN